MKPFAKAGKIDILQKVFGAFRPFARVHFMPQRLHSKNFAALI